MVQELVWSDAGAGGQVGEAFIRLVVVVQELLDEPAAAGAGGFAFGDLPNQRPEAVPTASRSAIPRKHLPIPGPRLSFTLALV